VGGLWGDFENTLVQVEGNAPKLIRHPKFTTAARQCRTLDVNCAVGGCVNALCEDRVFLRSQEVLLSGRTGDGYAFGTLHGSVTPDSYCRDMEPKYPEALSPWGWGSPLRPLSSPVRRSVVQLGHN
jgi:hypothetical protein